MEAVCFWDGYYSVAIATIKRIKSREIYKRIIKVTEEESMKEAGKYQIKFIYH